MVAQLILGYPKGSNMKVDYYINTHIPVAWAAWQPLAKSWRVATPGADSESPYEVLLLVDFESLEALGKAMADTPKDKLEWLQNDLKNYSEKPPVRWTQEVRGGGPVF
ncbi:uncharacterized protein BCR38DRAFT_485603 [Pseudomassariella vexata]|uniref:EthD domain-containing protein n=1 Tax=Pseudomassariella vexata TaxID=1141098 RepID=A0A1Y2DZC4_9PEZI|nr:uncharacterized protein BCR38DRAFT_485603 [Pseudomassariella vexata]ORY64456.1 hypothetical protein BCR38DRAFT_485603 [Pseudomassariella vexata]